MTREEIIRMAWQAARSDASRLLGCGIDDLERFAALAYAAGAAAEREACAKVCDGEATIEGIAQRCAAAIRARGQA